jgi:hypothetical protein
MRKPGRVVSFHRKAGVVALLIGGGLAALAVTPVHAMDAAAVAEHDRDKRDHDSPPPQRREPRREERPAAPAGPPPAAAQQRQESRPPQFLPQPARQAQPVQPAQQAQQAQQAQRVPQFRGREEGPGRGESRDGGDFRDSRSVRDRGDVRSRDGVVFGPPRGPQGPDARIVPPPRGGASFNRPPPPERIVPRLPEGYRQYAWGGTSYYHHGGHWYRPYGSSFVIVGAPYGLYMPYLPSYYSTFWYGGSRYYFADDTYYLYEPERHGYVVTRSPYNDDLDDEDVGDSDGDRAPADHELFVYPTRGQSERQQADDRYECHRWAVDQAHYDPTDAPYRAEDRAQYDRALTACLTGRGYSVK